MTGLLDPSLRVPPVPVDTADTCPLPSALAEPARTVADDLDDVRRSAQRLLSSVDRRPSALRIRAGEVLVELEWTDEQPPAPQHAALSGLTVPQAAPAVVVAAEAASGGAAAVAAVAAAPAPAANGFDVCASTVGTFYRSPEPGTAPFVTEGDHVRRGQQVAIIEVMKLMIPVEAEHDGRVVAVHVTDGTSVEYGDRLLTIAPATGH
ncbi:acetyl-CoA carboxylase biotin carboxyl carrier protein subunit [Catellatospora sp. NPDC049609]|uniref:acetyl-CoA carboxylase biotin carboxyl carrier protein n=1 Tax=Catellatospora sp. NPDC049609 TaxID=3155505 RepID=UPI003437186E